VSFFLFLDFFVAAITTTHTGESGRRLSGRGSRAGVRIAQPSSGHCAEFYFRPVCAVNREMEHSKLRKEE